MKKTANILQYVVIFLLVYLTLNFFMNPGQDQNSGTGADFDVTTKKEYSQEELITIKIRNNTNLDATIKNECPNEPLDVFKKDKGEWTTIQNTKENGCDLTEDFLIKPNEEITIDYKGWNHSLFGETGLYRVSANIEVPEDSSKSKLYDSNEFEVKPQGWFSFFWTAGFYQPIYNGLIYITSIIPGHDLGWAIILLTILIRTILLIPSQKAMKSQRRVQELQPKLNRLKEKYKDNQEALARETMMLWKENKVNPLSSCLPLFIQFPFLIAIFYVIQSGLNPDNIHLLYDGLKEFSLTNVHTNFLGILELTNVNIFVLPLIVGGLQFFQMKLSMMRNKKKGDDQTGKKKGNEMEMANRMMIYFMPVMIAVFAASVPAGVGLYWSTSTLYGIAQQFVVNREIATESTKVRVIKK